MSHEYDHPARATATGRTDLRKLAPALGVALVLGAASAASTIHLVNAWQEAAPFRAERVALAEADRLRNEVLRAEQQELEEARELLRKAGLDTRNARMLVDAKDRPPAVTVGPPAPRPREPVMQPARWTVAPAYRFRDSDIASGVDRASVRFSCTLGVDGRLAACRASETPSGAGLAALALPALDDARMEPVRLDGRPVVSTATVSLSWERQPSRPAARPTPPQALVASERPLPTGPVDAPATRFIPPNESVAPPSEPPAAEPVSGEPTGTPAA